MISTPGVIFLVLLFQVLPGNMGIYLGGSDVHMPEHGLNGPQVSSSFQKMRGERMTQHMGRDALVNPRGLSMLPQNLPESLASDPSPSPSEKKSGLG
jgi:hypothetical protein